MSRRRFMDNKKKLVFFQQRFFPAGTYNWTVPNGCESVDVFLVGGGGGGYEGSGGGGGYTKTFKAATTGYRDGGAITVTPGETITIVVGAGGTYRNGGSYSQFKSSNYRASGGSTGTSNGYRGGNGGSGGAGDATTNAMGGSDGSNANGGSNPNNSQCAPGTGQGHTTRDFGEPSGKRNAGGGGCARSWDNGVLADPAYNKGGASDYAAGSGSDNLSGNGGGGYGGGGGPRSAGGDGTVLIRGYKYQ